MYKSIGDYGIIGDMHAVALVSSDASIDYCSLPAFDSPTIFASLLDDERGGYFKIQPRDAYSANQSYVKDTNILQTIFRTNSGEGELYDFMPLQTKELVQEEIHAIHRCLSVVKGNVKFVMECCPRPHYASEIPDITMNGIIFTIRSSQNIFTLAVRVKNYSVIKHDYDGIIIHFSLGEGEKAHIDFTCGPEPSCEMEQCFLEETRTYWLRWLHNCIAGKCTFLGPYTDMINRSLLVLKLLTFQPTGAIAAAATTSLPESIGYGRNWDYRFTWLRDASFTLKALFSLGHISEAESFVQWLHRTYQQHGSNNLQIMYSLTGGIELAEQELTYLKGYKESKPVRIGNAAFKQNQWDIYGEIMDSALRLSDYAGKIDEELWPFFKDVCTLAIKNWRNPDEGIWEVRNGPFHFVYSKVMCWVALDRGIIIARRYGFQAPLDEWEKERDAIKEDVLTRGYSKELGSFVQHYESQDLDASLLLLPMVNFLPFEDKRVQGTIRACERNLMREGFLLRYTGNDGLEGEEGAFVLCNFWLIECLARSDELDRAKNLLTTTLKAATPLGLFSEEYDHKTNAFLGNFPQAFSHIGFINAISALLNVQYRVSKIEARQTWLDRIKKLLPKKIILNKENGNIDEVSKDAQRKVACDLKMTLNNLQGAYFDVNDGKVNYERMKKSESYAVYVENARKLAQFEPFKLHSDEEKKAFWINIYNILIIHGVIELDIQESVREVFLFFNRIGYIVGKVFFTPDDIEHGILRGNRSNPVSKLTQFSVLDKRKELSVQTVDPRIHFALVCASNSCPPIEFYDPEHIDEKLDVAARSFMNRNGIVLDKENKTVYLSQIFKWYSLDFGKTNKELFDYILKFTTAETKDFILGNLRTITMRYLPYDWNLNRSIHASS